jgi:hypothetical protein
MSTKAENQAVINNTGLDTRDKVERATGTPEEYRARVLNSDLGKKSDVTYGTAVENALFPANRPEDLMQMWEREKAELEWADVDEQLQYAQNKVQQSVDAVSVGVAQDLLEQPVVTQEDVLDAAEALDISSDEYALDPLLSSYVLLMSRVDTTTEREVLVREATNRWLAKNIGESSTAETILRTIQMFIPGVSTIDAMDVTDRINILEGTKEMVRNFQQLPHEKKLQMLPVLKEYVMDAVDGDEAKATAEILKLVEGDDSRAFELALDTFDIALWFTPLLKAGKASKLTNTTRNVDNADETANISNFSMMNPETEDLTQINSVVAATNSTPFSYQSVIPESTDGVSNTTINVIKSANQDMLAELNLLDDVPLRHVYRPEQEEAIQQAWMKEFNNDLKKAENGSRSVGDARIVDTFENGFAVEYKVDSGDGVELKTRTVRYTEDDAGYLDNLDVNRTTTLVTSPEVWMDKIFKGSVAQATQADFHSGKLLDEMHKTAKKIWTSDKDSNKKLNDVLFKGQDEEVNAYGIAELRDRFKMTEDEIIRYYNARQFFDWMWHKENLRLRAKEIHKGGVGVRIPTKLKDSSTEYTTIAARKVESFEDAGVIYDASTKRIIGVNKANETIKNGGYQKVSLNHPIDAAERGLVKFAIVPEANLANTPYQQLNKIKGYLPKIYEDVNFVFQMEEDVLVNGVRATRMSTRRLFDNKTDAMKYLESQRDLGPNRKMVVRSANDLTDVEMEDVSIQAFGGIVGDSRSRHKILFGLNGDEPKMVDAIGAMDANINHISTTLPFNNYRMGIVSTWQKSAKEWLEEPHNPITSPLKASTPPPIREALESSRLWIKDQMKIPTPQERRWQERMYSLGMWLEDKPLMGGKTTAKWSYNLAAKDPAAALRATAFHGLLGWFNPAQLAVQGQAAAVALSIDPVRAPMILPRVVAMRAAINTARNPDAIGKVAKAMAKASGMDEKDFIEAVQQYDKTGLWQSLKSTADYNAASMGYNIDAGALRRVADEGLIFFREGESFARMYGWLLAREEWLKAGNKIKNQQDIDAITERSVALTMNLNRANRAQWQKGWLSIPTQFQQINSKFIENIMPETLGWSSKKWSPQEKRRVLAGQVVMYGSAGVPFAALVNTGIDKLFEDSPSMSPEMIQARRNGMYGLMQEVMFGDVLQGSDRLSLMTGVKDLTVSVAKAMRGELPDVSSLTGPAGAMGGRILDTVGELAPYLNPNVDLDFTVNELELVVAAAASPVSTFSNIHKASIWYRMNALTDKDGNRLYDLYPDQMDVLVGKALGFTPDKLSEIYELSAYNNNRTRIIKDTFDAVISEYNKLNIQFDSDSEINKRNFQNRIGFILSGLLPPDRERVMDRVFEHFNKDSKATQQLMRAIENHMETMRTSAGDPEISLSTNSLFQGDN